MKPILLPLIRGAAVALVAAITFTACSDDAPAKAGETVVHHVQAAEARQLVDDQKVVVLDVRTPEEFKAGSIGGAVNIDFKAADFEQRLAALDRGRTYLVHCASGNRSTQSLAVFEKLNFPELYHLDGGFKAWEGSGLPVAK
jgi:rhodanese-related sulfurtransferase